MDSQWLEEYHRMDLVPLLVLSLLMGYFLDYTQLDLVVWFGFHSIHRFSLFIWEKPREIKSHSYPSIPKLHTVGEMLRWVLSTLVLLDF